MFNNFRVYLRALEPDDYKTSIEWRKDDEIWSMLVGPKYFVSEAYEKKWVEDAIFNSKNKLTLAICLKESDEHIGYTYISNIDWKNRSAQSHSKIANGDFRGKGYGTMASTALVKYAFEELNLHCIYSHVIEYNEASKRVREKIGFIREGILRDRI